MSFNRNIVQFVRKITKKIITIQLFYVILSQNNTRYGLFKYY